jgi:hypothetical protein
MFRLPDIQKIRLTTIAKNECQSHFFFADLGTKFLFVFSSKNQIGCLTKQIKGRKNFQL